MRNTRRLWWGRAGVLLTLAGMAAAADPTPVGWWKLDEGSGTVVNDSSGKNNTGTILGNPLRVAGKAGGALQFDGNGDYINCGNGPSLQIRNQITMAFWLKTPGFGASTWTALITKGDTSWRMSRSAITGNSVHMGIGGTSTASNPWFDAAKRVTDNQWHHIAGVYDGTLARIYIDGVQDASLAATGLLAVSANNVLIGENEGARGRYLIGTLDDIRLYNQALSAAQIRALALLPPPQPPVTFGDPKLKAAVESTLAITNPTAEDMLALTTLVANGKGISSLGGLEYAENLTYLDASNNQIADISPLAGLTKLTDLRLHVNRIQGVSALRNMTALTRLFLSANQITDISPLAGLTKLTDLRPNTNQIKDISALAGLTNLTQLEIQENKEITDVSAVAEMTKLTWLNIDGNKVTDIGPLSRLTQLQHLEIARNQITGISALSAMMQLTYLDASNN